MSHGSQQPKPLDPPAKGLSELENSDFEYGAALSATELEGISPTADFKRWERTGRIPPAEGLALRYRSNSFRSGDDDADVAAWSQDVEILVALGVSAISLTLEWSRLAPTANGYDEREMALRHRQIEVAKEHGVTVWACLVDGTLPGWFADDEGCLLYTSPSPRDS